MAPFTGTSSRRPAPPAHRVAAAAAVVIAVLIGALLAVSAPAGAGVLGAAAYLIVVVLNLQLGVATWAGLSYFEALGPMESATKAAAVVIIVATALTVLSRRRTGELVPRGQRRLYSLVALFFLWITISLAWSERPEFGQQVWKWFLAAAVFFVVAATISTPRHVRILCGALVIGTLASVLPGLGSTETVIGGVLPSLWGVEQTGRLAGGLGGPDGLAAQILPALPLAAALAFGARTGARRMAFGIAFALLAIALVATESRGGLVSIVVGSIAALVLFKGRRRAVLLFVACNLFFVSVLVMTTPAFVDRILTDNKKGTGRGDAWRLAYEIGKDHPITGVGAHNFPVYSQRYVDQLDFVENAQRLGGGLVVHNAYLEFFAEEGVVGLMLFFLVAAGCCRAAIVAARRFDDLGKPSLSILADSVVVGIVATLTAAVFLSSAYHERLWVMFALGPAMLAMARRQAADRRAL
jgi:putative inorganic carbon (hco3(-)) transporter